MRLDKFSASDATDSESLSLLAPAHVSSFVISTRVSLFLVAPFLISRRNCFARRPGLGWKRKVNEVSAFHVLAKPTSLESHQNSQTYVTRRQKNKFQSSGNQFRVAIAPLPDFPFGGNSNELHAGLPRPRGKLRNFLSHCRFSFAPIDFFNFLHFCHSRFLRTALEAIYSRKIMVYSVRRSVSGGFRGFRQLQTENSNLSKLTRHKSGCSSTFLKADPNSLHSASFPSMTLRSVSLIRKEMSLSPSVC